jgi:hypothetical protein
MIKIAAAKKKQNIAEYLLFMWQMEDLLRGVKFDVQRLESQVLSAIEDEQERLESLRWFEKLASEMKSAGLEVSGHHADTYDILNELQLLQQTLMTVIDDPEFKEAYNRAKPIINEFRTKTERVPQSDAETALTGIYGVLTLKLAGKTISPETQSAVDAFAKYMALLAKAYRQMKTGELPLNN